MRYQGPRGQVTAKGPVLTKDGPGRGGEKQESQGKKTR